MTTRSSGGARLTIAARDTFAAAGFVASVSLLALPILLTGVLLAGR